MTPREATKMFKHKAVTLIELLVSITIMGIIVISLATFLNQGINIWLEEEKVADIANRARRAIVGISRELKHTERGGISNAASNSITFEVDLDKDGNNEKIKYYVSGNDLKRKEDTDDDGDLDDETGYNVVKNISSLTFTYYDSSKTSPVAATDDIRYVKITVGLTADSENITVSTEVYLRNFKSSWS